jgi:hypothetical protein
MSCAVLRTSGGAAAWSPAASQREWAYHEFLRCTILFCVRHAAVTPLSVNEVENETEKFLLGYENFPCERLQ